MMVFRKIVQLLDGQIILLLIGIMLCSLCCSKQKERSVTPAFYHWKNKLDISQAEFQYLSDLKVKKIYLRLFDVDWESNQASPISILEKKTELPDSIAIIPTIFITNRTIINSTTENIPDLANKIFKKMEQVYLSFENDIPEVQFDCDWSATSRAKYFQLLNILKTKFAAKGKKVSATIRLHQIKYFEKTGVPPVDRGVLMFYNMGDIDNSNTENSIIDISLAKNYLSNFNDYPLPLDIALPIFKWGLVFQEKQLVKIINNLGVSDLQDSTRFIKIDKNRFEIIKSTYLQGYYLYQQDQIRLEKVEIPQLQKAADLLSGLLEDKDFNLIFYHLDTIQIKDYPHEVLEDIRHRFH